MTDKVLLPNGVLAPEGWQMDVHSWFDLTYASYLVVPRSVLQSMPADWQDRFVRLLYEMGEQCEAAGVNLPDYRVHAVAVNDPDYDCEDCGPNACDEHVLTTGDRWADYERGRRRLWD